MYICYLTHIHSPTHTTIHYLYKSFIISEFGTYPDAISIDPTCGYLYISVTDQNYKVTRKGYVAVLNPVTLQSKTLILDLNFVIGLVLHPLKG